MRRNSLGIRLFFVAVFWFLPMPETPFLMAQESKNEIATLLSSDDWEDKRAGVDKIKAGGEMTREITLILATVLKAEVIHQHEVGSNEARANYYMDLVDLAVNLNPEIVIPILARTVGESVAARNAMVAWGDRSFTALHDNLLIDDTDRTPPTVQLLNSTLGTLARILNGETKNKLTTEHKDELRFTLKSMARRERVPELRAFASTLSQLVR